MRPLAEHRVQPTPGSAPGADLAVLCAEVGCEAVDGLEDTGRLRNRPLEPMCHVEVVQRRAALETAVVPSRAMAGAAELPLLRAGRKVAAAFKTGV
ncbi:hypothetical protein [Aureimonas ureilytica]|uniref:hypothetical protein n=1 Tax=Aureimonas ureilytica TaxID=401562 RepID=UPI0012DBF217|nr:hypothetical protein [Aureimonas ureilytica]